MAIKGLTDRGMAFPEIGQIRKGSPKQKIVKDGKEREIWGKDLDFFRVDFDERETAAVQLFRRVYGEKPTEIHIILPFNEIERMWDAWLEAYTAGRLVARSDGEKFVYLVDTKTGEVKVRNGQPFTPYTDNQVVGYDYQKKPVQCKPTGRLKVIIPELARAAYMTVMTTSVNDIANISAQLEAFRQLNNGQIAGIPFVLRRRPKKISVPGKDGQRTRMTKWMISIEADPEWVKAKLTEVKRLALPGNGLALPASASILEDEIIEATGTYVDEDDEQEETGMQEEPAGQTEPPAQQAPAEQPPVHITKGDFWSFVSSPPLAWDAKQAKEVADKYEGDYAVALEAAKAQIPPATA